MSDSTDQVYNVSRIDDAIELANDIMKARMIDMTPELKETVIVWAKQYLIEFRRILTNE